MLKQNFTILTNLNQNYLNKLQQISTCEATTLSEAQLEANAAAMIWSYIAEPALKIAGLTIQTLGLVKSLHTAVIHNTASNYLKSLTPEQQQLISTETTKQNLEKFLQQIHLRIKTTSPLEYLKQGIDQAIKNRLKITSRDSPNWPQKLNDLDHYAPYCIWYKTNLKTVNNKTVAVVGARAASNYGEQVTAKLVQILAQKDCTIISGAAYGIDAIAHQIALANKTPTVAVLAGGLDRIYPIAHTELIAQISEANGCVISEMPPKAAPTRWRFLQRNRIIAALADSVLVTEAGLRSGSINTAGHAAQLGRNLAAVPGQITNAGSAGCYKLIKEYGAELISSEMDLLESFQLSVNNSAYSGVVQTSRELSGHIRVLDSLPLIGGRAEEEIAKLAGLSMPECLQYLNELELLQKVVLVHDSADATARIWKKKR